MQNQYLRMCALSLDRTLRAYSSTLRTRLDGWLLKELSVAEWHMAETEVTLTADIMPFSGLLEEQIAVVPGKWGAQLLATIPKAPYRFLIGSTYYAPLEVARDALRQGYRSFDFMGVEDWSDVGLQILPASGRRPDCVPPVSHSVKRMRPLLMERDRLIVFGPP